MTRSMVKDRGDWNCGLYCGVVMPLVPSRMEDTMCWEIDYKLFAEQKKAQEIRSFGSWLTAATRRLHRNVLAVALANKLARIAWTVLAQGRRYEARVEPRVEPAAA